MRRYSFNIDLSEGKKNSVAPAKAQSVPEVADGFEMSSSLRDANRVLSAWPSFQRHLEALAQIESFNEDWEDEDLGAEYLRIYQVSHQKILSAEPGFAQTQSQEAQCFFLSDGTKVLVSRLKERPHERVSEIRLNPQGLLSRLYYENTQGPHQILDDVFESGLQGLEEDLARFASFPNYVLRVFLLQTQGNTLESSFRGVFYYHEEQHQVVFEEATGW